MCLSKSLRRAVLWGRDLIQTHITSPVSDQQREEWSFTSTVPLFSSLRIKGSSRVDCAITFVFFKLQKCASKYMVFHKPYESRNLTALSGRPRAEMVLLPSGPKRWRFATRNNVVLKCLDAHRAHNSRPRLSQGHTVTSELRYIIHHVPKLGSSGPDREQGLVLLRLRWYNTALKNN